MLLALQLFLMSACSSDNGLVNRKFIYDIPLSDQKLPYTSVLVQPMETGCKNCIVSIKNNMDLLRKEYYIVMPKSPYSTENLNCYQPNMHDYAEWNSDYIFPTVFVVDSSMMIIEHKTYTSLQLAELLAEL